MVCFHSAAPTQPRASTHSTHGRMAWRPHGAQKGPIPGLTLGCLCVKFLVTLEQGAPRFVLTALPPLRSHLTTPNTSGALALCLALCQADLGLNESSQSVCETHCPHQSILQVGKLRLGELLTDLKLHATPTPNQDQAPFLFKPRHRDWLKRTRPL